MTKITEFQNILNRGDFTLEDVRQMGNEIEADRRAGNLDVIEALLFQASLVLAAKNARLREELGSL